MPEVVLNVRLLEMTENPVALIFAACRQCYSPKFAAEFFDEKDLKNGQQTEFIRKVVASGHESPLEHVKFTFAIEGVSRALTHQLVRHRLASYSQQSQRYVKETNFDYIIPPSIAEDDALKKEFVSTMELIQSSYNKLLDRFNHKGRVGERANQDVRFVLPQAAETKIVVTMNCRELIHFFHQRCCSRAQWEIKRLADQMLVLCRKHLPEVFDATAAKCDALGYCPEGKDFSCRRYPLKEDVLKIRRPAEDKKEAVVPRRKK